MGLFDKLKSMVTGESESETTSAPKQEVSAIRVTDKQLSIKDWLLSLSPEWQEILSDNCYLRADDDAKELDSNFRKATSLDISDNAKIKDITPIGELCFLKSIDVSECRVTDLSPLKKLKSLEKLNFSKNPIKDLSPLAEITSLKNLRFGGRDFQLIDNIDVLANLINLEELSMTETLVTSLKALSLSLQSNA